MDLSSILLIFDCDGVLIDSELIGVSIELEQLQSIGCRISFEEYLNTALGKTEEKKIWTQIAEASGVLLPPDFVKQTRQKVALAFEKELAPISGIEEALRVLPYRKCVASGSLPARLFRNLELTGLSQFFNGNLFSGVEVPNGKPHPDLFLYAAEKMNTDPRNCIVIEDSPFGVEGAKKAGMKVLGFTGGSHIRPGFSEKLQAAGVDKLFSTMKDLPDLCKNLATEIIKIHG